MIAVTGYRFRGRKHEVSNLPDRGAESRACAWRGEMKAVQERSNRGCEIARLSPSLEPRMDLINL